MAEEEDGIIRLSALESLASLARYVTDENVLVPAVGVVIGEIEAAARQFLNRDRWLHPHNPRIPFIRVGEKAIRYKQETLEQYIQNQTKGNLELST